MYRPLIALALLAAPTAQADCASNVAWSYPAAGKSLAATGALLIQGDGDFARELPALADRNPMLVSGGTATPVRVVHQARSRGMAQVLITPTRALPGPGEARLRVDGDDHVARVLSAWRWAVVPPPKERLIWRGVPSARPSQHHEFGCGPARYLVVETPLSGPRLGVMATVTGPRGGSLRWLFRAEHNLMRAGHGMCGGPLELVPGAPYAIQIEAAVNLEGRLLPPSRGRIGATGPAREQQQVLPDP